MRSFEGFLIVAGGVMWEFAFLYGPGTGTWVLGKWGLFFIALAGVVRVAEFLIPHKRPQPKRTRGPVRKCPVCGKPSIAGSRFCSYHTKYGPEEGQR
jgi:hypothetical protein